MPSISLAVSLRGQLLSGTRSAPPTPFSPIDLFALAEPGVWYDPSDISTLFQDAAGTTPVTTPGQTVALMLDKSKGGVGTNGAARRNQFLWTQDFRDTAAAGETRPWTYTNATVAATSTLAPDGTSTAQKISETSGSGKHRSYQVFGLNSTTYTFTCYMKAAERSWAYLNFGDIIDRQTWFNLATGAVGTVGAGITASIAETPAGSGWYRCSVSKTTVSANPNFDVGIATADGTFSYTGVTGSGILIWGAQLELGSTASAYQRITSDWPSTMTGNHATQATAASRPTFGVVPLGGRRNLLTWSEDFRNTATAGSTRPWANTAVTITANAAVAPTGATTAQRAVENTANAWHRVDSATFSFTGDYTLSVYAKADTRGWLAFAFYADAVTQLTYFDLVNGSVGTNAAGSTAVITSVGDGWYRCSVKRTLAGGISQLIISPSTGNGVSSYLGDGTSGILIWGAQLELGSTATAYQKVTTQFDVTEAGVQSLSYLSFDGVDDFMLTGTITPGIDRAQVFTGVRKLSDAALGALVELGILGASGTIGMGAPAGASATYRFASTGTIFAAATSGASFAAPNTAVLSGASEVSADSVSIRRNGTLISTDASDQGTGNYLAYPLYIGRRGGTTAPFNGQIYSLITRFGANLDTTAITNTETWVAGKTGVTL